jgi:hypothetical protein
LTDEEKEDRDKNYTKLKEMEILNKQTLRIQLECCDTIVALKNNQICWMLLNDQEKTQINIIKELFCTIFNRFFNDNHNIKLKNRYSYYIKELGFIPTPLYPLINPVHPFIRARNADRVQIFETSIFNILPKLLPSTDFFQKRDNVRKSLQLIIETTSILPKGTMLALYGNFIDTFIFKCIHVLHVNNMYIYASRYMYITLLL